ncbi:MAG: NYN domain-containing protein [Nanoarchaeota archaeon]|nr:NYN domain-containing protein [Nanoarchaeota archaeon]
MYNFNYDLQMLFSCGGDDVYLATDLIRGSYENLYDVAIIILGDADFIPAIKLAQKNGKKVINAFFPKSSSYQLRNCCDGSISLRKSLS